MGNRFTTLITSLLLAICSIAPVSAHHSYAAFDRNKEITVQGSVRTWELGNPHAYLWLYVPNKKGGQDIWGMEAPSPAVLVSKGMNKYSVKVGDKVTVVLNPLRDGRNGGNLVSITLPNGATLDTRPNDQVTKDQDAKKAAAKKQ